MRPSGRTRLGRCHCGAFLQDCSHGQSMLAESVEIERAYEARRRDSHGSDELKSENTSSDPNTTPHIDLEGHDDSSTPVDFTVQAHETSAITEPVLMTYSESNSPRNENAAVSAVADAVEGAPGLLGDSDPFDESRDHLGTNRYSPAESTDVKSPIRRNSSIDEDVVLMSPNASANVPKAKSFANSPETPQHVVFFQDNADGSHFEGTFDEEEVENGECEDLNAEEASIGTRDDGEDEDGDEDGDEEEIGNCSYCGIRDYFSARKAPVCESCPVPLDPSIEIGSLVTVSPRTWPGINKHGGDGRVNAVHRNTVSGDRIDVVYYMGGKDRSVPARWVRSNDPNAPVQSRAVLGRCKRPDCPSLVLHCDHNQDPASWIPCAKPECKRDAVDCSLHSQEPWFWKLCVKPRCGCYAGECGHEQDPERWILCLREDCDAYQFDCKHNQDPTTWPSVPETKAAKDRGRLQQKVRKHQNKEKARRSLLVRGAGILAGEAPTNAKDVLGVGSRQHSSLNSFKKTMKTVQTEQKKRPDPLNDAINTTSDDSDSDSLVENILHQKRRARALGEDDEDTDDELDFLRFKSNSSALISRGPPSSNPSRAESSSSRSPGNISPTKLQELALNGYKSDGEDHNASDSESNDEDPDFLVAEGEENANATYDMGHRAKKRLRRWRSLDTPEQRSEKVSSMHHYLENIGLPYLEREVAAAKALIDQHAKPIGVARYKFAAATAAASSVGSEEVNHTDEAARRQRLREAATMVKSLKLFSVKVLRRDGLHLVDDMYRRTSLKNKDVIGLKNDNIGASIQEQENRLKATGIRLVDMGVDTDNDFSHSSDDGSLCSSSDYAPVDSPLRKSSDRHHASESDSGSIDSLDEIMGDRKRVRRPRPSGTESPTSKALRRKKVSQAHKLSHVPPRQTLDEESDSSIDEDAPLGDQRAKLVNKPKHKRPRNMRNHERYEESSGGSRQKNRKKMRVQDDVASDDGSDTEDSMRIDGGAEASDYDAMSDSLQFGYEDPDIDDFEESTATNLARRRMQSRLLDHYSVKAPTCNDSKKHPWSTSEENRPRRRAEDKRSSGGRGLHNSVLGVKNKERHGVSGARKHRQSRRHRIHGGASSRGNGTRRACDGGNRRNVGGSRGRRGSNKSEVYVAAPPVDTTVEDTAVNMIPSPVWRVQRVHSILSSSWTNGSEPLRVGSTSVCSGASAYNYASCHEEDWSDSALMRIERTFRRYGTLEPLAEEEVPAEATATAVVHSETTRAAVLAKRLPSDGRPLIRALADRLSARIRLSMVAAALVRGRNNNSSATSDWMTAAAQIKTSLVDAPAFEDLLWCSAFAATAPSPLTNFRVDLVHAIGTILAGAEAGRRALCAATSTRYKDSLASQARTSVVVPGCSGFFGLLWSDPWHAERVIVPSTARHEDNASETPWGEAAEDPLVLLHCFALDWLRPPSAEIAAAQATVTAGVALWSPSSKNAQICQEASRAHLSCLTKLLIAASPKVDSIRRRPAAGVSPALVKDDPTLTKLWDCAAVAAHALESQDIIRANNHNESSLPKIRAASMTSVLPAPDMGKVASWQNGSFWGFLVDAFIDCYAHRAMRHVKDFLSRSPWPEALIPSQATAAGVGQSSGSTSSVAGSGASHGLYVGVSSRSSLLTEITAHRQSPGPLWSAALRLAQAHAKSCSQSSSNNLVTTCGRSIVPAQPPFQYCSAPLLSFRTPFQPNSLWGASALIGPLLAASPLALVHSSTISSSLASSKAKSRSSSGHAGNNSSSSSVYWAKQSMAWVRCAHPLKRTGPKVHAQCVEIVNCLGALTSLGCPAVGTLAASTSAKLKSTRAPGTSNNSAAAAAAAATAESTSSNDATTEREVAAVTSEHALAQLWAAGLRVNAHALLVRGRHRKFTTASVTGNKASSGGNDNGLVADDGVDSEEDIAEDSSDSEDDEIEAPRKARLIWSMTPGARTATSFAKMQEPNQGASTLSASASSSSSSSSSVSTSSSSSSSSSLALGDKDRLTAHAIHFYTAVAFAASSADLSSASPTSPCPSPTTIASPGQGSSRKSVAEYLSAVDALLEVSAAALAPLPCAWPSSMTSHVTGTTKSAGASDESTASYPGLAIALGALPLDPGLRQPLSCSVAEATALSHLPRTTSHVSNSSSSDSSNSASQTAGLGTAHDEVLHLSGPRAAAQALVTSLCRLTCRNLAMGAGLGRKRLAGQLFNDFERLEVAMADKDSLAAEDSNSKNYSSSQHYGRNRQWVRSGAQVGTQHALSHAAAAWTVAAASEGLLGDLGSDAKAADVAAAFVLRSARCQTVTAPLASPTSNTEARAGSSSNGVSDRRNSSGGGVSRSWSEAESKVYACATAANATLATGVLALMHFGKVSDDSECAKRNHSQMSASSSLAPSSSSLSTAPSPGAVAVSSKLSAHFATALHALVDAVNSTIRLHSCPDPCFAASAAQKQLQAEVFAAAVSLASVGATSALLVLKTASQECVLTWRAALVPAAFQFLELAIRPDVLSKAPHHGSDFLKLCLKVVAACAPQCTQSHGPLDSFATQTLQRAAALETQQALHLSVPPPPVVPSHSTTYTLSSVEASALAAYAAAANKQLPALRRLVQMAWTPAGLDLTALQLPSTQAYQAATVQNRGGVATTAASVAKASAVSLKPPAQLSNVQLQPRVLPPSNAPQISYQQKPPQPVRRSRGVFGAQTTSVNAPVRKGENSGRGKFIPKAPVAASELPTGLQRAPATGGLSAAFPDLARPETLASAATASSAHQLPTHDNNAQTSNSGMPGNGRAMAPPRPPGFRAGAGSSISRTSSSGSNSRSNNTRSSSNTASSSSSSIPQAVSQVNRVPAAMVDQWTEVIRQRRQAELSAVSQCAVELLEVFAALVAAHLHVAAAARTTSGAPTNAEAVKAFGAVCDDIAALRPFSSHRNNTAGLGSGSGSAEVSAWVRARLAGPTWASLLAERYRPIVRGAFSPSPPLPQLQAPPSTAATAVPTEAWPLLSIWLCAITELRTRLAPKIAAMLDSPRHLRASIAADQATTAAAAQAALMVALGGKTTSSTAAKRKVPNETFNNNPNVLPDRDVGIGDANKAASAVLLRDLPHLTALVLELLRAGPSRSSAASGTSDAQAIEREVATEVHGTLLLVRAAQSPPPPGSGSSSSSNGASMVAQRFSAEGVFRAALRNVDTAIAESRALAALPMSSPHLSSSSRATVAFGGSGGRNSAASATLLRQNDWVPAFGRVVHSGFALQAALLAAAAAAAPPPCSTSSSSTASFAHVAGPAAHPARLMATSVILPRYLIPLLKAATADYWYAVARKLPNQGVNSASSAAATTTTTSTFGNSTTGIRISASTQSSSNNSANRSSAQPGCGLAEVCALPPLRSDNPTSGDHKVRRLLIVRGLGSSCCKDTEERNNLLTSFVSLLVQLNFSQGDAKAQLGVLLNAVVAERAADKSKRAEHRSHLAGSNSSGLGRSESLDRTLVEEMPTLGLCFALTGSSSSDTTAVGASNGDGTATSIAASLFPPTAASSSRLRLLRQHARSLFAARLDDLIANACTQSFTSSSNAGDLQAVELAALQSLVAELEKALAS